MKIEWEPADKICPEQYWHTKWNLKSIDGKRTSEYDELETLVVLGVGKEYFIGPIHINEPTKDLGPFDTLKAAKIAAETMIRLNAYPEGWFDDE